MSDDTSTSRTTARASRVRRLWPVGALVLAAVAACVTVTALNDRAPGHEAASHGRGAPAPSGAPADGGSASPSAGLSAGGHAGGGDGGQRSGSPAAAGGKGGSAHPAASRVSVRSLDHPDRYWHVSGGRVRLDPVASGAARRAATFTVIKGLSDARCYSFATSDGGYLRHRDDDGLRAEHDDGSARFERNATFCPRRSSFAGATLLESADRPGRFLRQRDHRLTLARSEDNDLYRADSAFLLVAALA
ncbi:AbfB domain-containing protein [Streptomyces sp. NPDC048362]|uniref:AbfB domain-containing protein n=1 Tax=Streptomyces sp. NPDC048362 TaxID=3365539 RepID=UPI00371EDBAF